MTKVFLWLNTSYFVGKFDLNGDTIVSAPPIAKWAIGKSYQYVIDYFDRKNKLIDWRLITYEKEI